MSKFAIKTPYFIVVVCLIIALVGAVSIARMPVDMFPKIDIPVVVVATFYSGMPAEQVETNITYRMERFLTLGSGIEHMESRSLTGVSIIKIFFQPGSDPDAAASSMATLAMAEMSRLPPGTLPPVVMKFDASNLPVCLVTLKGEGLSETKLKDLAQSTMRNQLAGVRGASVPQAFGGRIRQIMLYANPFKLEAHRLSLMDVVRSIGESNVILPAGHVQLGNYDYNIYTNGLLETIDEINRVPVKVEGHAPVRVADIGRAEDSNSFQFNSVRVNGQRSVYLPILKQGGDSNTIAVVDGIREMLGKLSDVPDSLVTEVVFDQSQFVKTAIDTLLHEGALGLFLTSLMILIFLGSMRATVAVFFSIPLSALATFIILQLGGSSLNTMVLGGLALALSRLIDNSVVVLENIYRHLEMGEPPAVAAELGGREVALPVLSATLATAVVFFPVTMLFGVSKYLFSSLALAVVISLFASYAVAMTVVPLFCAQFIKAPAGHGATHRKEGDQDHPPAKLSFGDRFNAWFNQRFEGFLDRYDSLVQRVVDWPRATIALGCAGFILSLGLFPLIGMAFFPSTDAGQFVIRVKAASGTRLMETEKSIASLEELIRREVGEENIKMIVSNIGIDPGFSAMFTTNSGTHAATIQVALQSERHASSAEYMERVRNAMREELPQLSAYFASGSLVESVLNMGLPAPINLQIVGSDLEANYAMAQELAAKVRALPEVAEVFIPQDLDQPALKLEVDRVRARELGLSQREVVTNVITALNSNQMVAPSMWVDPKNGNNYYLSVQYEEEQVKSMNDLRSIPLRGAASVKPTRLDMVSSVTRRSAPTELTHYQIRRTIDVYVRPVGEDLGIASQKIDEIIAAASVPKGMTINMRGMVESMRASFDSFAVGLILSVVLLFLILVAQFRSFLDPFIILLALPPGITGVLLTLWLSGTTLNVMSLMGVLMLVGVATSNSILIVEFAHKLIYDGAGVRDAIITACRVRLRPVLMTSLATIIGLLPMALKLGEGSESYAPLARALLGGLAVSVIFTVFLVPAGFYLVYGFRTQERAVSSETSA